MFTLPARFASVILTFATLFRQRTWLYAQALLLGAILAPGSRTVASVLRVLGLAQERRFVNFHRVLNRAVWSSRRASRLLVQLVLRRFVPTGPIVLGLDDTVERRRGRRIRAKGIYRDPVRSSDSHFVKASGLRWLSVMLLAPIPWAHRVWALPVLTALAPRARYHQERGQRHKRLTDWARQLLRQLARWLQVLAPERPLIVLADTSFAALELLSALAPPMAPSLESGGCLWERSVGRSVRSSSRKRCGCSSKAGGRWPTSLGSWRCDRSSCGNGSARPRSRQTSGP